MSAALSNRFYSLFASVFFLFAGFGLFLNSAGVKLAEMGVDNIVIGALNAAFFAGASLSAVAAHRIVSGVGHIRSFSVFGAVFAMASLMHLMTENLTAWGILRTVLGFCYFSMLMIAESWFAEQSAQDKRARVLAVYNLVYYLAFTLGILLLSFNLSSDNVFVLGTLLVMTAMLPVSLTRMKAPQIPPRQKINVPRVLAIAPLAFVTAFLAGVLVNGLFTMASVFLLQQSFTLKQISVFLTTAMVGGFVVQLPLAKLSDKFGRRNAILGCSALACVAAACGLAAMVMRLDTPVVHNAVAFAFGCGLFGLYALSIARANDRLPNNMNTVEVSRSLLFCYGLGSLAAPLLLGVVMDYAPKLGFYALYAAAAGSLAAFAWKQNVVPEEERSVFVNVSGNTGAMAADLDPRNKEEDDDFDEAVAQAHVDQLDNEAMPSETADDGKEAEPEIPPADTPDAAESLADENKIKPNPDKQI
ncbi:MFS transporter [Neisseria sp. CCUG12390]|uniref:MFS transporter n=1 Tax=Neisseria sp. CCUG12390 TaxID=3392035 RepID=UPI003A1022EF